MLQNIPAALPLLIVIIALLTIVLVVWFVRRRSRSRIDPMVTILWNGREITFPKSVYGQLLEYLTPAQRRLIVRVERARQRGQEIAPEAVRAYDAFIASAIRELIFHEPGLANWFVNR